MPQHLLVTLIFAACLWLVISRIARMVARARNNDPRCLTCSETNCPLHKAQEMQKGKCGCCKTDEKEKKTKNTPKNCKKRHA